jgi:T5SS/PEP-CTERM-associated repeat protein
MTTIAASSTLGIVLSSPSYTNSVVINPGVTISSGGDGIFASAGSWTIQNDGRIGSTIAYEAGVYLEGAASTLINDGTIAGIGGVGENDVQLAAGGVVINQAGGVIGSPSTNPSAVYISGDAGTVTNAGTINAGVWLQAGGSVTNQAGGAIISDSTSGGYGVGLRAAGTVINAGRISGLFVGVDNYSGTTTTNQAGGPISGNYAGVFIGSAFAASENGGNLINQAGGTVNGDSGVISWGADATVTNAGAISGTSAVTIIKDGITLVLGDGVSMNAGGTVTNQSGGTIAGASYGIYISGGAGTVVNAGTISGSSGAVRFAAGNADRLVIDPGALFVGTVSGGNTIGATAVSTLELAAGASTGTLSGLGSKYINFGSIVFDAGADWLLSGNTSGLAGRISGFGAGDTIELIGITATGSNFTNGILTLDEASGAATLDLAGGISLGQLVVTNVVGGTEVTVTASANSGGTTITGDTANGITLTSPAYVNPVVIDAGVTVSAYGVAIAASIGSWTIENSGSVASTSTAGVGIYLSSGGLVTNAAAASITGSTAVHLPGAGTVINAGSIAGNATFFSGTLNVGSGIMLGPGGSVTNESGGLVTAFLGVNAFDGTVVVNYGSIAGNPTATRSTGNVPGIGVLLDDGGSLVNKSGGVVSAYWGVNGYDGVATVVNAGTIADSLSSGFGLHFNLGGSVTNQPGGRIVGGSYGIFITGAPGTVWNSGTVIAIGTTLARAVALFGGGYLSNAATGVISSSGNGNAVRVQGAAGTIVNVGTLIDDYTGRSAIALQVGGRVTNQAGGLIQGSAWNGIYGTGGAVTVVNAGTIAGDAGGSSHNGILLEAGGAITNAVGGTIVAPLETAIYIAGAAGTVVNTGLVASGAQDGVDLTNGGFVSNQAGGIISGYSGVYGANSGALTVVNAGTIDGSRYALTFAAGQSDRLVVDPGAVFSGTVTGGNTIGATVVSTLELASAASAGTLSGLGTQFVNFGSIAFDTGADWFVAGNTSGLAGTISGFARGDTIEITGITATGSSYANGILTLTEASGAATLDLLGSFTPSEFVVTNVSGGVEVSIAGTTTPVLTTLVNFDQSDGQNPNGGLIADAAGDLFGMASSGGANGDGTVFEIPYIDGSYASTPTTLVTFNGANGANPYAGLLVNAAGDLFGSTQNGGANGDGTVFEIIKTSTGYASTPSTLVTFNGANGANPLGDLIADTAGDLIGMTFEGGANNDGTVFEIAQTGTGYTSTPTALATFNGTNGANPEGGLIADAAGDLFGTTAEGGTNGDGTVFELVNNGTSYTLTTLVSFNATDGETPIVGLIADAAGDLFGATAAGGTYGDGTVFEIVKTASSYASAPTVLVNFNGTDGQRPDSGLLLDAAGDLFGTTVLGGANGDGMVFEIVKTGTSYASTPTTLINFNGGNGATPEADLISNATGTLFGATDEALTSGYGTVFELAGSGFQVASTSASTWTWVGGNTNVDSPSDWTLTAGPGNSAGIPEAGDTAINNGTLVGYGLIAAALINNGTVEASNNSVPGSSTGGDLEIQGAVSGTGSIIIAPGATLQIDGSLGAGQSIAFSPGGLETLILGSPAAAISNSITGFAPADAIAFANGITVNSVSLLNGNTLAVTYNNAAGSIGVYDFTNISVAVSTPLSFLDGRDLVTDDEDVSPTTFLNWTGSNGTNFSTAGNWNFGTIVPSVADYVGFANGVGGTISGTGTAWGVNFFNTGTWSLAAGTSLSFATELNIGLSGGGSNGLGALTIGSGSTITTGGFILVGNYAGDVATLTVSGGGVLDETAPGNNATWAMNVGGSGASGALAAASASVVVTGAGSIINLGSNSLQLADGGGNASMTISQGGSLIAVETAGSLWSSMSIGKLGQGTLTVTDPGSQATAVGGAYFGRSAGGSGTLIVENYGRFLAAPDPTGYAGLVIGNGNTAGVGGTGTAIVTTDGVLDSDGYVTVGLRGTQGQLTVLNGGTVRVGTELYVGDGGTIAPGTIETGNGTLTIDAGGTVELTGPAQTADYGVYLGTSNDGTASTETAVATVSGTGALLSTNGNGLAVGYLGDGSLTVSQGGSVVTGTPDDTAISALSVGRLGNGTLTVTDAETRLTANGGAYVGRGGTGTLTVENQATMDVLLDGKGDGYLDIGNSGLTNGQTLVSGGSGLALVTSGGDLFSQTGIIVGEDGDSGSLTVNGGGTVEATQSLLIGSTATVPAGGIDITTAGTTTLAAATPFAGSGTVTVGAGSLLRVDGTGISDAPDITVGAGTGSTGILNVTGTGALLTSNNGTIVIGGAGSGTLDVSSGGSVQVGSVTNGAGGTIVLGGGAISASGSSGSTGQISGFGAFVGQLASSGTIIASGGTLELTGSVTGAGELQIASNAVLRLDAAPFSGQSVNFGTDAELILNTPGTAFSNAITGLDTGDTIEFGNGMTITSASVANGNTIAVDFHGSGGLAGIYDLTDASFAPGSSQQFSVGVDASTGDGYVEVGVVAPISESWLPDAPGDFDDPTKWIGGVVPGPSTAATIDFADDPQVTHDTGADTVQSLTNTAGDFVMAGGTLTTTVLTNASQISWTGGLLILNTGLAGTASLDNTATATLAVAPNGQRLTATGTGTATLANAGTITVTEASGTANIDVPLTNTGEIVVDQGVLSLNGGGSTNAYLLRGGTGGTLQFGTQAATGTGGTFTITGGFYAVANTVVNGSVLDLSAATPITFADSLGVAAGSLILGAQDAADQGAFTQTGGTIAGSGTLTTYGAAALDGGVMTGGGTTQLLFTSTIGGTIALDGGDTLANAGRLNWSSGDIELGAGDPAAASQSATLANAAGALLYVTADATIAAPGTAAAVTNAGGLVVYAGAGETAIDAALTNTGVIQLQSGTLSLNGGGSSSGSDIFASPGAVLRFGTTASGTGGTFSITGGLYQIGNTVVDGSTLDLSAASGAVFPDLLSVTAGALSLGALNATDQNELQQTGGTIAGSGTLTVFGGSALTGGVQTGPGVTVLNGTSTLGGTFALDGGRTLANDGWLNWSSGGIALGSGAPGAVPQAGTLDNASVLYVTADGRLSVGSGGSGVLDNSGVLAVLAGAGVTSIDAALDNTGILQVQSGTLSLNGGGSSAGNGLFVAAGAVLQFGTAAGGAGGTFSVTGAAYTVGSTEVTGGTLDLAAAAGAGFATSLSIAGSGVVQLGTVTASVGALSLGAGGELVGSGFLFVGGNASLDGGLQSGSGATILTQDASIGGGADLDGGRTLQNDATLVWSGGTLTLGGGDATLSVHSATLSNVAGAVFAIEADGTVVSAGSGLLANAGTIEKDGGLGVTTVAVAVNNTGTVAVSSGTLAFGQAVSGAGTFVLDGTAVLDLVGGAASGSAMTFLHPGGTLETAALGTFGAVVSGFASGDEIDAAGVGFVSGTTTVGFSGGTLTVSGAGGAQSAAFVLAGSYAAGAFAIGSDGHGGTAVGLS